MNIPQREQVEQAFLMILQAPNEELRQQADCFLRQIEKENPSLLLTLVDIFENSQVFVYRQQALILIKNIIIRNWIKVYIKDGKRIPNIPDDLKNEVKNRIVSFLGVIQDSKLQKELNLIIKSISKYDFPQKFQLLTSYFHQGLLTLEQYAIQDPLQVYSQFGLDLVVTLKCVEQEVNKSRMTAHKHLQYEFIQIIYKALLNIWEIVTNYQKKDSTSIQMNQISKKLDRTLSCCIMCFHPEVDLEKIQQIFMMLLNKTAFFFQVYPNNKAIQINIKTITHSLTNIQQIFSLSIIDGLNDYLQLLKLLLSTQWQDRRINKIGLIGLAKVLKTYFYYCTIEQFKSTIINPKHPNYAQIQQQAVQIFTKFFESELTGLLEILINTASIPSDLSDEELIEQEEDNTIDDLKGELQTPTYTLTLIVVEQLMLRFPDQTLNYFTSVLNTLTDCQFQVPNPQVLESFFAFLGQVPRVLAKLKIEKTAINILPVLSYLAQRNHVQSYRRCAVLCNRYINTFDNQNLINVLQLVIMLMGTTEDQTVRYQALMCIKSITINPLMNAQINWSQVTEKVAPIVVDLLHHLSKATILWPLLQLLEKLIVKCQQSTSMQSVVVALSNSNLAKLMETRQELLVDALSDMLQTLIVQFDQGTPLSPIYKLALILIKSNIGTKNTKILNLYLFILQEYQSIQGFDQEMKTLFEQNSHHFNSDTYDLLEMGTIIQIIDENLLLNFIDPQQYPSVIQFLVKRYEIAQSIEGHDIGIQIKNSCVMLLQTILFLLTRNQVQCDVSEIFMQIVKDLVIYKNTQIEGYQFTLKAIEIISRLILQNTMQFLQLFQKLGLGVEEFLTSWIEGSNLLKSYTSRKVNAIALLIFIKYLNEAQFKQYFQLVMQNVVIEMQLDQDKGDQNLKQTMERNRIEFQNSKQNRLSQFRVSQRKQQLLETWVYQEVNLTQYVKQCVQELMNQFKVSDLREVLNDKDLYDILIKL